MIKVENIKVFNFEGAFRGLRNPLESWDRSDSWFDINDDFSGDMLEDFLYRTFGNEVEDDYDTYETFYVNNGLTKQDAVAFLGPKDIDLAQRMIAGGTDESKFMRQIFISMDIVAPLFWWKEFDTYKVGTVANSCSTMHKLANTPIKRELFSFEGCEEVCPEVVDYIIEKAELLRQKFLETKDKRFWRALIEILPNGWNQRRTVTFNYQVARAMYFARKHHKVFEWRDLCEILKELPYGEDFICYIKEKKDESN